jgi:hypothetical protein
MWRTDTCLEVGAACNTVAIDFDIGVCERCCRFGNGGYGQQFLGYRFVTGRCGQYRQHDPPVAVNRGGQGLVLAGILAVGVGEHQVQRNTLHAGLVQAIQQLRMGAAWPRPLPKLLQAVVIDGDDRQAGVGRVVPVAHQ